MTALMKPTKVWAILGGSSEPIYIGSDTTTKERARLVCGPNERIARVIVMEIPKWKEKTDAT